MSSTVWFRFFPSDWLAGTRGMAPAETGIYIHLIAMMYEKGGPIAEDHARLARLCGASNSSFRKIIDALVSLGKISRVEGGLWNDRVGREQVYRAEKSEAGKHGAEKRWQKAKQNQMKGDATAMRRHHSANAGGDGKTMLTRNQSPEGDTDVSPARARTPASKPFDAWWARYPHKVGKGSAEKAYASALRRGASPDDLASGIDRYIAEKPPDRPWCNPATWLNQDRWADEPAPSPSRTPNGGRNGFGNRPSPADTTRGILDEIDRRRAERRPFEHVGPTLDGIAERRG